MLRSVWSLMISSLHEVEPCPRWDWNERNSYLDREEGRSMWNHIYRIIFRFTCFILPLRGLAKSFLKKKKLLINQFHNSGQGLENLKLTTIWFYTLSCSKLSLIFLPAKLKRWIFKHFFKLLKLDYNQIFDYVKRIGQFLTNFHVIFDNVALYHKITSKILCNS